METAVTTRKLSVVQKYLDPAHGSTFELSVPRWRAPSGSPLWIEPGPGIAPDEIDGSVKSLWRYARAFPLGIERPITLGEGLTPLIPGPWQGSRPLFKLDFVNPTGSFKDRGSSVMLSYLRERGIGSVVEDSSGNGGSSVAGYAAAGGMGATIFAPSSTSLAKLAQAKAYGATVHLVDGPREQSQRAAATFDSEGAFYAGHNWQPFFLQGTKTLAYEIWEDLGFNVPDNVIVPVGAGSSLLGLWLGFSELVNAGQISRLPRLFAAQPLNCSPVDAALVSGEGGDARPVLPTLAEGAAIARPLRMAQMLDALRGSGGGTVAVTEDELVTARRALAHLGFFVEPTSALAAAAQTLLLERGVITPEQTTVILLTGSGLKSTVPF